MTDLTNADKEFLKKLEKVVNENKKKKKFGVSDLAKELSMSRSNLHRKVNALTKISVSQYIRQERLKSGRDMLRKTSLMVSEVAYKVGFSSTSYFIKCFHDYFGYPPGEVGKRDREAQAAATPPTFEPRKKRSPILLVAAIIVLIIATVFIVLEKPFNLSINQKGQVIAVLPLQNVSGDENNNAMTDNVHDALTTELGKISKPPNRVISRTSTLKYRNPEMTLQEIAKDLNVNIIVEGSVSKVDDVVGINIQLIDVFPKERHLHAETYEDNIKNILRIQSKAVKDIAKEINIKLSKEEEDRLDNAPEINPETYQIYLRGMELLGQGTAEGFDNGIDLMMKAIEKDPGDPFAYAALALAFATKGHGKDDAEEAFRQAEVAAQKALKIDPTIDIAYTALAMIYLYQWWDWPKAKEQFENSIIANPNNAYAHAHFAWYHMLYNDKEKTLYHAREAAIIEPWSVPFKAWLSLLCLLFEEYEEGENWANKALKINPKAGYANLFLARLNVRNKQFIKAREYYEKLPNYGYWKAIRVDGYVKTGQRDKAMKLWNEMEEKAKTKNVNSCHRGMMAASLGFIDMAFDFLFEAAEKQQYPIAYIHGYGCADYIKDDPRFTEPRQRLNLPGQTELMALNE